MKIPLLSRWFILITLGRTKPTEEQHAIRPPRNAQGASHEFESAFCHLSSSLLTCGCCNRTFFCTWNNNSDFEEKELAELRANAAQYPDAYIEMTDCSSLGLVELDGIQYVEACPCNAVTRYETFIVSHRYNIAEYLKLRSEKLAQEAEFEKREVISKL